MVKKKKLSPTEFIESLPQGREHVLAKLPRKEIVNISKEGSSKRNSVIQDDYKRWEVAHYGSYANIHTHPTERKGFFGRIISEILVDEPDILPSSTDLDGFIRTIREKTAFIGVRDSETGEVRGYQVIKKTDKTPSITPAYSEWKEFNTNLEKDLAVYHKILKKSTLNENPKEAAKAFDDFAKKYHLQHRVISAEGYEPSSDRTTFVRKNYGGNLEKTALAVSMIGILGGIFFLSSNITGNAIGNLTISTSNIFGAVLFVIGLVSGFFCLRGKR
ncbi:MAG: hypothetical protein Q7S33_04790 [Nanoarchaeota archaeon]|nr:hypothetical protein [Nanoarchaeota archaeon]